MAEIAQNDSIDPKAASLLAVLCGLWGLNAVAIKISNQGIDPICAAGIRSVLATAALLLWMRIKKMPLFPGYLADGLLVGILFGLEFGLLYSSLLYTTVSSAWILLYTTPFFHALGAHCLLPGDRLSPSKWAGLTLAFLGIVLLLSKHLGLPSLTEFFGDMLAMTAAILWAATTITIKKRLVNRVSHHHTLLYQTMFSIPILFFLSFLLSDTPVDHINELIIFSLLYQGFIIAFASYLLWFLLVHRYPVSRLSAFTFLTPVFAAFAGALLLNEPLTLRITGAMVLVSSGIYLVNR